MTVWICATCAVEHPDSNAPPQGDCAICADHRQYVRAAGQRWTTLDELAAEGRKPIITEVEPGMHHLIYEPSVGIGQHTLVVTTPAGNVLWEPTGYVDAEAVAYVGRLGGVTAVAASHPHMYGVQVEWSRALGGVPVLVSEADREWVQRPDSVIEYWSGIREVLPGVTLVQCGGHFKGSTALHWPGADGRGVLLAGDTIMVGLDNRWVSFMRSYPNYLPLSVAGVEKVVAAVAPYDFDRLYDNFGKRVDTDASAAVRRSAERYIGWLRGDFDDDI